MDNTNETEEKKEEPREENKNQYHPAFCNAMELELYSDRDMFEFRQSIDLNTLPREIDFLVIRKDKDGEPHNELARFFRRINIWEFKSYEDKLNVLVYNKTMSYAYDYLTMTNDKNGIEDVTLSFLREGWPKAMMRWLEGHGYVRLDSPEWVARYRKGGCPDLQIVNIVYPDAPLFLHVLSHKAEPEDIFKVSRMIKDMPDKERMKVRLVMNLSYRLNGEKGGDDMDGFFETFVDPLNEVIKQKDEALKDKDEALRDKDVELEKKDAEIARLKAQLAAVGR